MEGRKEVQGQWPGETSLRIAAVSWSTTTNLEISSGALFHTSIGKMGKSDPTSSRVEFIGQGTITSGGSVLSIRHCLAANPMCHREGSRRTQWCTYAWLNSPAYPGFGPQVKEKVAGPLAVEFCVRWCVVHLQSAFWDASISSLCVLRCNA